MSIINSSPLIAAGDDGYRIERSLRFNSPDSAYLNRTPASAGNRKTWTWSGWVKRSTLAEGFLFAAGTSNALRFGIIFNAQGNQEITIIATQGGSNVLNLITTPVYRDVSAWYHLVFAVDTTQATSTNRAKLYINGAQVTALATATYPAQNTDLEVNTTNPHVHGCRGTYTVDSLFAGYLTEINFIDGQALTPSSFGETNTVTGVWGPKRYAGTYGTNGFYLKFADNSNTTAATLGKDSSGNSNNWTPNNFSVTAGVGNDSFIDVPTPYADGGNGRGNYATLNPTSGYSITLTNGNLDYVTGSSVNPVTSTFSLPVTGKWYWEVTVSAVGEAMIGIQSRSNLAYSGAKTAYYRAGGTSNSIYIEGTVNAYNASSYTNGDVIGVAFDATNSQITWYKNNTQQGGPFSLTSLVDLTPIIIQGSGSGTNSGSANFGQRPFTYTPPTGFLALNTQNLPEPSIKKPNQYMDAVPYTGTGVAQSIVNSGSFQPDLVWLKRRNGVGDNGLYDSVRGVSPRLVSNTTGAEAAVPIDSFNSNGFSTTANYNNSGESLMSWQWKESATPGFDIVTFTGTGSAPATISHGLGVAPKMMIVKNRDQTGDFVVYHSSITNSQTGGIFLNLTNAWGANSTYFNNSVPTSSNFQVGSYFTGNNIKYVAYLWSEVAGFSKFGAYTGNGSSDGPFVHCGFRPRFILFKQTNVANEWVLLDTARNTYNATNANLYPNRSNAEDTSITQVDVLSNGFKLREGNAGWQNISGGTYIFAAFAESPFKYSLAR